MRNVEISLKGVDRDHANAVVSHLLDVNANEVRVTTSDYIRSTGHFLGPVDISAEDLSRAQAQKAMNLAEGLTEAEHSVADPIRLAKAEYLIVALTAALAKADGHLTGPDAGKLASYSMSYLRGKA